MDDLQATSSSPAGGGGGGICLVSQSFTAIKKKAKINEKNKTVGRGKLKAQRRTLGRPRDALCDGREAGGDRNSKLMSASQYAHWPQYMHASHGLL